MATIGCQRHILYTPGCSTCKIESNIHDGLKSRRKKFEKLATDTKYGDAVPEFKLKKHSGCPKHQWGLSIGCPTCYEADQVNESYRKNKKLHDKARYRSTNKPTQTRTSRSSFPWVITALSLGFFMLIFAVAFGISLVVQATLGAAILGVVYGGIRLFKYDTKRMPQASLKKRVIPAAILALLLMFLELNYLGPIVFAIAGATLFEKPKKKSV